MDSAALHRDSIIFDGLIVANWSRAVSTTSNSTTTRPPGVPDTRTAYLLSVPSHCYYVKYNIY